MDKNNILEIFRSTGALLEGHFKLTSGRHSEAYFQCARVLQFPEYLTLFSKIIADHFKNDKINTVISPAIGGIVIGTEVGRQLNVKTIFTERKDGTMKLRRGFEIKKDEHVLVVEDVLTTGGSINEVIKIVEKYGGKVAGVSVVVDRSDGKIILHRNQVAVIKHKTISYAEDEIPAYLAEIPIEKPGSRKPR
ncbi:MAG: orotate phosphoribosyltransferase [Candidatus Neomarinimicrobiota bacterium]